MDYKVVSEDIQSITPMLSIGDIFEPKEDWIYCRVVKNGENLELGFPISILKLLPHVFEKIKKTEKTKLEIAKEYFRATMNNEYEFFTITMEKYEKSIHLYEEAIKEIKENNKIPIEQAVEMLKGNWPKSAEMFGNIQTQYLSWWQEQGWVKK